MNTKRDHELRDTTNVNVPKADLCGRAAEPHALHVRVEPMQHVPAGILGSQIAIARRDDMIVPINDWNRDARENAGLSVGRIEQPHQ